MLCVYWPSFTKNVTLVAGTPVLLTNFRAIPLAMNCGAESRFVPGS
jgi:hypothetical protein